MPGLSTNIIAFHFKRGIRWYAWMCELLKKSRLVFHYNFLRVHMCAHPHFHQASSNAFAQAGLACLHAFTGMHGLHRARSLLDRNLTHGVASLTRWKLASDAVYGQRRVCKARRCDEMHAVEALDPMAALAHNLMHPCGPDIVPYCRVVLFWNTIYSRLE